MLKLILCVVGMLKILMFCRVLFIDKVVFGLNGVFLYKKNKLCVINVRFNFLMNLVLVRRVFGNE